MSVEITKRCRLALGIRGTTAPSTLSAEANVSIREVIYQTFIIPSPVQWHRKARIFVTCHCGKAVPSGRWNQHFRIHDRTSHYAEERGR